MNDTRPAAGSLHRTVTDEPPSCSRTSVGAAPPRCAGAGCDAGRVTATITATSAATTATAATTTATTGSARPRGMVIGYAGTTYPIDASAATACGACATGGTQAVGA